MVPQWAIDRARVEQEALMVSEVTITDPVGSGWVFDPATGEELFQPGEVLYSGKALVQSSVKEPQPLVAGSQPVDLIDYVVKVPWSVFGIHKTHHVTLNNPSDPFLDNQVLVVESSSGNDLVTCRRLRCTYQRGVG